MFTGKRIMCPVAYDAFSTGISGRTFAMPIASTPPCASSLQVRLELPLLEDARTSRRRTTTVPCGGQRLAAGTAQLAQVAEMGVPAPVVEHEICREPQRVVVRVEQLVGEERELLRELHQLATIAAGSLASTGTGID